MTDSGRSTSGEQPVEGGGSAGEAGASGDANEEPEPDEAVDEEDDAERDGDRGDADHLDGLADGAGCTEIWERLSESRGE